MRRGRELTGRWTGTEYQQHATEIAHVLGYALAPLTDQIRGLIAENERLTKALRAVADSEPGDWTQLAVWARDALETT